MNRGELGTAVEWAAREGWNPGLDDAEAFYAADPEGFLQAERAGEVVGTISAVKYGADFGFVGFYIVKPEMRGHRHGLVLAEHALARLEGRNIGIDGVLAKQRQYAKFFGFEFAYRNIRYGGVVTGRVAGPEVVPVRKIPFDAIAAYDRRFFPAEREAFLRAWLAMPHAMGFGWVGDGGLRGCGVIRQCRDGFKIGPLFADDAEIAEALFLALCERTNGQPVFLDVPEVNA
ncbi:MAG: GNAT family N-acetyltransferase, partial [Chthoniobacterales bacterium]